MSFTALIDQVRTINSLQHVAAFKQSVNDCYTYMEKSFPTALVDDLVISRSNFVDALVSHAWQLAGLHEYKKLTLVAVGGYGRDHNHRQRQESVFCIRVNPQVAKHERPVRQQN